MYYILFFLIALLLIYLIQLHLSLRKITKQLTHINTIHTNIVIQLPMQNPFLKKLSFEINRLMQMNKENYQKVIENKDQFDRAINNISHDIRTPLTVANGYVQLLNQASESEQSDLIEKIRYNLDNVEVKLEDLLTYNRLIEQQIEVNFSMVKLSSILERICLNFYDAFLESGIDLSLSIEKNLFLISDETILTRIIENAIGNILNHGSTQAEVVLKKEKDSIILFFSNDTKKAIANYDKLFDRFYTEDFARINKNSGLGLFIIKELTTILHGDTSVYGENNQFHLMVEFPQSEA